MSSGSLNQFTFANGANATYIDGIYRQFKQDPGSVDPSWRAFFEGYEFATSASEGSGESEGTGTGHDNAKVEAFINAYRHLGHLSAHLNPLAAAPSIAPNMTPEYHSLKNIAGDAVFHPANLPT